ncbi:hypothetical protein [Palleronia abyssalis]|uniref:Sulfotransferase domain-containing protein n=1 Tax=Palleronia abyssalis TaxID=1501240 RepID=A0A2R8C2A0_9RHOB|nr:hypothetical protein [Palleronia abyssalis]SPJ26499.1 hypothetical protein PAA8504_04361 [Palleronia abyssalis]
MYDNADKRTLYLHIGLPKTASSWLQSHVFSSMSHLEFIDSPRSQIFQGAGDLADGNWLMASVFKRSSHIWKSYGDAIFTEIFGAKDSWQTRGQNALISDERIGREGSRSALLSAHLAGLRRTAFEWGFEDVKVVFMIRRQDTWLASHYAQMSDRNSRAGQRDFGRLLTDVISPARSRYNFGTLLDFGSLYQVLVDAMGPDKVMVWPYEHLQETPMEFLRELLAALNASPTNIESICNAAMGSTANVRSSGQSWKLRQRTDRRVTRESW